MEGGGRERGREGGREGGGEGGREGGREGEREGEREGGREGGREVVSLPVGCVWWLLFPSLYTASLLDCTGVILDRLVGGTSCDPKLH